MPVFADRTRGTPNSIALKRTAARCWYGPAEKPNHASFVIFNSQSGRGFNARTSSEKIASYELKMKQKRPWIN